MEYEQDRFDETMLLMKRSLSILLLSIFAFDAISQNGAVGIFDGQQDVGYVKHPGSSTYDPSSQSYTITGLQSGRTYQFRVTGFAYGPVLGEQNAPVSATTV